MPPPALTPLSLWGPHGAGDTRGHPPHTPGGLGGAGPAPKMSPLSPQPPGLNLDLEGLSLPEGGGEQCRLM